MTQISFFGLALTMILLVLSYTQAAPTISLEKRYIIKYMILNVKMFNFPGGYNNQGSTRTAKWGFI